MIQMCAVCMRARASERAEVTLVHTKISSAIAECKQAAESAVQLIPHRTPHCTEKLVKIPPKQHCYLFCEINSLFDATGVGKKVSFLLVLFSSFQSERFVSSRVS